jgi:hypothetical protein
MNENVLDVDHGEEFTYQPGGEDTTKSKDGHWT